MSEIKLSLAIPYKQRLENIRILFEGLANQTMDSSQFEVLVGAMEYSEEYVSACRGYIDRLNITSVMSSRDFEVSRARNLAMRQASGEVIVHLDADTLLAPDALANLYDHHFSYGQNVCIVGQVLGYGNNRDGDVASVDALSYAHYKREDVYALHLPHLRDTEGNFSKARRNWRRFLRKWARTDIELASAFGDVDANSLFPEYRRELKAVIGGAGCTFGVIVGTIGGNRVLVLGASLDAAQRVIDPALLASFDDRAGVEVLPLVGMGLPYDDASFDEVRVLPPVSRLSAKYWDAVRAEIQRVSKGPVG